MLLEWPRELIPAGTVEWECVTPSIPTGSSLGGVTQLAFLTGGPFWRLRLGGLIMRGRDAILAGRRVQAALLNGAVPILVSPCDCRQPPRAVVGVDIEAELAADAALRATTLTLALTGVDRDQLVGALFSVDNAVWGPRLHVVEEDLGGPDSAAQVRVNPPLRAAALTGAALDFNTPRCTMRLDGDFEINHQIRNQLHTGDVAFCELERPPEGWTP